MQIRSCALFALLLGGTHYLSAEILYSVTELNTLGVTFGVSAFNDVGQFVGGLSAPNSPPHAFLYSNDQTIDLGTLPGFYASSAYSINNLGQVTGVSYIVSSAAHAFLYSNGQMMDLGVLGGIYNQSAGYGINNLGQVVGSSGTGTGEGHAFLYSNGQMMDLGTLGGIYNISSAAAINDLGQIAGSSFSTITDQSHAFLYSNGRMMDLGTLGGTYNSSSAFGINDLGQVVGWSSSSASTLPGHAFLYSNGHMVDLGTLPGFDGSYADFINNLGQVVGCSYKLDPVVKLPVASEPTIYSKGQLLDLNDLIDPALGVTLSGCAYGNDHGQILAGGSTPSGANRQFLLTPLSTPVPEPSTLALVRSALLALVALAYVSRRIRV